ncbi:MAG TPA: hypothetical protein VMG10_09310, partial [Gemmataceae bacterium]|nr:hypothetical protein [Gemmataceae bacterium]
FSSKNEVMLRMHRAHLLIVTALLEVGTALLLLFVPALPLVLLLGIGEAAPEVLLISRVAGASLLAIGTASWFARNGEQDFSSTLFRAESSQVLCRQGALPAMANNMVPRHIDSDLDLP